MIFLTVLFTARNNVAIFDSEIYVFVVILSYFYLPQIQAPFSSHCGVKSVQIRSFLWSVFSLTRAEYKTGKTLYLENFHVVSDKCSAFWVRATLEQELPSIKRCIKNLELYWKVTYSFSHEVIISALLEVSYISHEVIISAFFVFVKSSCTDIFLCYCNFSPELEKIIFLFFKVACVVKIKFFLYRLILL